MIGTIKTFFTILDLNGPTFWPRITSYNFFYLTWLFKPFDFGNKRRMSDEKLTILKFKYLRNKKWYKQVVNSTRTRKSYKTEWLFSFHSDNWQKLAIFLQKIAIFNIYHIFAPFMKHRGCRFFYLFGLCDVRNKVVFLILEHSCFWGLKYKILAFKPLLQEIRLKNLTSRKLFSSSHI